MAEKHRFMEFFTFRGRSLQSMVVEQWTTRFKRRMRGPNFCKVGFRHAQWQSRRRRKQDVVFFWLGKRSCGYDGLWTWLANWIQSAYLVGQGRIFTIKLTGPLSLIMSFLSRKNIIVNSIIQKLKSKQTSLKKYRNCDKLKIYQLRQTKLSQLVYFWGKERKYFSHITSQKLLIRSSLILWKGCKKCHQLRQFTVLRVVVIDNILATFTKFD